MNWITIVATLLIALVIEGLTESTIYRGGYSGFGSQLFGRFRWNYHVPLFFRWTILTLGIGAILEEWWLTVWMIPLFAVVEDIGWHLFTGKFPVRESWIGRIAGGLDLLGYFIPHAYSIGIGLSIALYLTTWIIF